MLLSFQEPVPCNLVFVRGKNTKYNACPYLNPLRSLGGLGPVDILGDALRDPWRKEKGFRGYIRNLNRGLVKISCPTVH